MIGAGIELFESNYILGDVLGSGGMGTVYSAIQVSLGRRVAIKLPHPALAGNPDVSRRFRTEARAGAQLDHPNIAHVIDFGGRDGALFLVMEYVAGVSLDKLVDEQGPLDPRVAVELVRQLLAALAAAHASGILHADVKTANLLVESTAGAPPHARLIDFGLARFSSESTHRGDRLLSGTPEYLAPELIESGSPTVASDLYAAGVVLYELLTGVTPFGGGSIDEIMHRHLEGSASPPSLRSPGQAIPPALEAVVMRALARDPCGRFVSAAQFADALRISYPPTLIGPARIARGAQRGAQRSAYSSGSVTHDWQRPRPVVATMSHVTARPLRLGKRQTAAYQALASRAGVTLYSGLGNPAAARGVASIGRENAVRATAVRATARARSILSHLAQ